MAPYHRDQGQSPRLTSLLTAMFLLLTLMWCFCGLVSALPTLASFRVTLENPSLRSLYLGYTWYNITSLLPNATNSAVMTRCNGAPDALRYIEGTRGYHSPTAPMPAGATVWEESVTPVDKTYMSIVYRAASTKEMSCSIYTQDGTVQLASESIVQQTALRRVAQVTVSTTGTTFTIPDQANTVQLYSRTDKYEIAGPTLPTFALTKASAVYYTMTKTTTPTITYVVAPKLDVFASTLAPELTSSSVMVSANVTVRLYSSSRTIVLTPAAPTFVYVTNTDVNNFATSKWSLALSPTIYSDWIIAVISMANILPVGSNLAFTVSVLNPADNLDALVLGNGAGHTATVSKTCSSSTLCQFAWSSVTIAATDQVMYPLNRQVGLLGSVSFPHVPALSAASATLVNNAFPVTLSVSQSFAPKKDTGFVVTTARTASTGTLTFRVAARGPYSYLSLKDVFIITGTTFSSCASPASVSGSTVQVSPLQPLLKYT